MMSIILGYRAKGNNVHLRFGGWFAEALESYHKSRAEGFDHDFALHICIGEAIEATASWASDHPKKNRETLLRTIVWYLEQYKDDPAKTVILANGKPAVELSFQFQIGNYAESTDDTFGKVDYSLCGHLDRLVDFDGTLFVQDQKTTGSTLGPYFFQDFKPHTQMSLYTLASKVVFNTSVAGVMIDAAQIAIGFTAFARSITTRSDSELEEWLANTKYWIGLAAKFASEEYWPKDETSCSKYGGCAFRNVCSKSPEVRKHFLDTEFETSDPWNPLKQR